MRNFKHARATRLFYLYICVYTPGSHSCVYIYIACMCIYIKETKVYDFVRNAVCVYAAHKFDQNFVNKLKYGLHNNIYIYILI